MIKKLLLLCLCFWHLQAHSQRYTFLEYSVKDGLVQSQVKCLFQDDQGYIWCGTLGGASQFDGRVFKNYSYKQGLINNHVNCITQLSDGSIVLGTAGAISLVKQNKVTSYIFPDAFKESQVNDMMVTPDGLLIATSKGIVVFDGEACQQHEDPYFAAVHVKKIAPFKEGWVVVTRESLVYFKEQEKELLWASDPENPTVVFDAEVSADGSIWLACNNPGLLFISDDGVQEFGITDGLVSSIISDIMLAENGNLWLSSIHGISKKQDTDFVTYDLKSGLPTEHVTMTLEDAEGNIWIATEGKGLVKFSGENIETFSVEDGLCSNSIMSVSEDQHGDFWFASYDNGVCKSGNGATQNFDLDAFTTNNRRFWTSLADSKGNVWLGSSNGLVKFDGEFHDFGRTELANTKILSLAESRDGSIWIGSASGIDEVNSNGEFITPKNAPKARFRCITEDGNGKLWMATKTGLWSYDGKEFEQYQEEDGLVQNSTYTVCADDQNRIWVGTGNGISVLDEGGFHTLNLSESSGSNHINFIKSWKDQIWIGTNNGLFRTGIKKDIEPENLEFDHFAQADGLNSLETNLNSAFIDQHLNLWFGTADGLVRINLKSGLPSPETLSADIHLTGVEVNLEPVSSWSEYKSEMDSRTGLPTYFCLPHHSNHVTFHFNGISTTYPEDVRYQYMLEGLDKDWQPVTKAEFAHYSNLPFDNFTFKVRAIGKSGAVGSEVTVRMGVLPPFWYTWWFILLAIGAISAVAWIIFQKRKEALLTQVEKEKYEYKSKMLALEQQTLNSSMNRHFIFNALNSIQYYINRKDKLSANRYLSSFAKLIRMNLDGSESATTSLREEVERLKLYLQLEHMRFQDKFEYSIQVDEDIDLDGIKVPAMLLQPFLENSIWHGILPNSAPGEISVDISRSNGSIAFTVTDNGIGIDTSLRNKPEASGHISKGMQITNGRIELIKKMTSENVELQGPYEIRNDKDEVSGTQVRIILPVKYHEIYPN